MIDWQVDNFTIACANHFAIIQKKFDNLPLIMQGGFNKALISVVSKKDVCNVIYMESAL